MAFVQAAAPRVWCPQHDVTVSAVPWARHASRFTRDFEDQAAWLAVNTSRSAVAELLRIAWRTVGGICERVSLEASEGRDQLAGLSRIGIDEISHRKGHRYLTVVICHDTGRLVWAPAGRDKKTVHAFLDELGEERCKQITLIVRREVCIRPRRESMPRTPHAGSIGTEAADINPSRAASKGDLRACP